MHLLALLACRPPDADPGEPAPVVGADSAGDSDTAPPQDPTSLFQGFVPTNIIVLHTDTLRYDHTPWYGYARDTLPSLSARTGWVRWERMYATSGWTAPATTSLLTGLTVEHHGVRMVNEVWRDELVHPTFATAYGAHGYASLFVSGNDLFGFPTGLTAGFQSVDLPEDEPVNSAANVASALRALDGLTPGTPFVLHIQAFDPHQPWRPSPAHAGTWAALDTLPFELAGTKDAQKDALALALDSTDPAVVAAAEQAVIDVYDEELLGLDQSFEALLVALEERALLDETLVVFTADHGETLFDRSTTYGHGRALYEELVRLPLVFYNPALTDASIDGCLGSAVDIHPTLLTALGLPVPDALDGRPLQDGCRPLVTASIYRETTDETAVSLVQMTAATVDFKLLRVCDGGQLGYDLGADPGSVTPLPALAGAPFPELSRALDALEGEAAAAWPGSACAYAD